MEPVENPILCPPSLGAKLKCLINGHASLLDLGCGTGAWAEVFDCPIKMGVDIHRPHLEARRPAANLIPLCLDLRQLDQVFFPRTFAVVLLMDIIEHLPKETGLSLLKQADTIATHRVVLFTPRGFYPQQAVDLTGRGGAAYQEHLSGWEPEELLGLGYNVLILQGFHGPEDPAFLAAFGSPEAPRVDALLAWKDVWGEWVQTHSKPTKSGAVGREDQGSDP